MGSEMDPTRMLIASCLCSLLSPFSSCALCQFQRRKAAATLQDTAAVVSSQLWDHTLALVSRSLCYDIRLQVTLSNLVSLAKCCSEQFGCHQSASVFWYQCPLSSCGISAHNCARQQCDAHKISTLTTSVKLVENSTITNPEVRGEIALSLSACVPSFPLHTVHWFVPVKRSCPRSCGPQQQDDQIVSLDNVTLQIHDSRSHYSGYVVNSDALCTMSLPQPRPSRKHKDVLVRTWLGLEDLTAAISPFRTLSAWWQPSDRHEKIASLAVTTAR